MQLAAAKLMRNAVIGIGVPVRRVGIRTATGIFAIFLALGSVGCTTAAIWIFTIPRLGQAGAALAAAAFLLVFGLVVLVSVNLYLRNSYNKVQLPAANQLSQLQLADLNRMFKENKSSVLVATLIAGFFAGERQHNRR